MKYVRQRRKHICFHSYVDLKKLTRRPWGKVRVKKIVTNREGGRQTIRDSNTENKLRADGRGGQGREENG